MTAAAQRAPAAPDTADEPPQVVRSALRMLGEAVQHALRAGATRAQVADAVLQGSAAAHNLGAFAPASTDGAP